MVNFPKKLESKLAERSAVGALRSLPTNNALVDFASNDYLGFARDKGVLKRASELVLENRGTLNGATGSRLLTGNNGLYQDLENLLARFHDVPEALVFNSGYDANIGFFSAVPQRDDVVFYDEFIHASIRDGIVLGRAKGYKFKHNDLGDLERKCRAMQQKVLQSAEIYIVSESVFSMDGDAPNLVALVELCEGLGCHLIVDEAHAVGVFGKRGEGLVQQKNLQNKVFARTITFGKAIGGHGAAILGSGALKDYLMNFARSFVYTTALPPHAIASVISVYGQLVRQSGGESQTTFTNENQAGLNRNILFFCSELERLRLKKRFIPSRSAIQCCLVQGNQNVSAIADALGRDGFDVKPIKSPTVAEGHERIRFCLHAFNTKSEITGVLEALNKNLTNLSDN